jgi:hypothetical protein
MSNLYRKRPVVVKAEQVPIDPTKITPEAVTFFEAVGGHWTPKGFHVPTRDGSHIAAPGSWVVLGHKGFYVISGADFTEHYEAVQPGS